MVFDDFIKNTTIVTNRWGKENLFSEKALHSKNASL